MLDGCCVLDSQTELSKRYAPGLAVFFWAQKGREFEKKYLLQMLDSNTPALALLEKAKLPF